GSSTSFCFNREPAHSHLPTFPTRRSSDLHHGAGRGDPRGPQHERERGLREFEGRDYGEGGHPRTMGPYHHPWSHKDPLSGGDHLDRKSTRLNSSHVKISYAVI